MPRTDLRLLNSWIIRLVFIMTMITVSQVWSQPGGMGPGGGMGGPMGGGGMGGPMDGGGGPGPGEGPGRKAPPRFDMSKASTITGQVESLGSYGLTGWRSMPGLAVQGLVLKTEQGNIEVYLGPPSYVTEQKFTMQKGDFLEVKGLKVFHEDKEAFLAAEVKKNKQKLSLLDENGSPLWKQQEFGGQDAERASRGGRDPNQGGGGMTEGGMMGGGGRGKGR